MCGRIDPVQLLESPYLRLASSGMRAGSRYGRLGPGPLLQIQHPHFVTPDEGYAESKAREGMTPTIVYTWISRYNRSIHVIVETHTPNKQEEHTFAVPLTSPQTPPWCCRSQRRSGQPLAEGRELSLCNSTWY